MNNFVKFIPIRSSEERANRFWEIRERNEKAGIGKTEIVTFKKACADTQAEK